MTLEELYVFADNHGLFLSKEPIDNLHTIEIVLKKEAYKKKLVSEGIPDWKAFDMALRYTPK